MPIRFRCVYCDKLLGIARRKAGAVVNCPQCQQPLIVPTPEPEEATASPGEPNKLFERDDLADMLDPNPDQTYRGPAELPVPTPVKTAGPPVTSFPTVPQQRTTTGRSKPASAGIVLSTGKLIVLGAVVLALVGGAFVGGYLIGKG
jgi:phage FluMu protein Com